MPLGVLPNRVDDPINCGVLPSGVPHRQFPDIQPAPTGRVPETGETTVVEVEAIDVDADTHFGSLLGHRLEHSVQRLSAEFDDPDPVRPSSGLDLDAFADLSVLDHGHDPEVFRAFSGDD